MAHPGRTPPRFVPTLTSVVEPPAEAPAGSNHLIDDLVFQVAPPPVAPLGNLPSLDLPAPAPALPEAGRPQISEEDAFRLEEQLLHRVLQRVDLKLEERLTDTVSLAVQRQLDAMMPALRSEIETVLRDLVVEALALELSEKPVSNRP